MKDSIKTIIKELTARISLYANLTESADTEFTCDPVDVEMLIQETELLSATLQETTAQRDALLFKLQCVGQALK